LDERARERLLSLVTLGRRHGVADADVLEGTGLSSYDLSDTAVDVRPEHEYSAIRNLQAHTGPLVPLPLEAGFDFHLHDVRDWGTAMATSRVLGEALAFSLAYAEGLPRQIQVSATVEGDDFTLRIDDEELPADVRDFVVTRNSVFIAMTARELLGRPVPLLGITARAVRPAYFADLDHFAGVTVEWEAPHTTIRVDPVWLAHPLPGADERAHLRAVEECRRQLAHHRARDGVSALARKVIAGRARTEVGIGEVAAELGTSERSLRRRLAAEGTSFRRLVALERFQQAGELFTAGHTVEQTAVRLGYSEPSAFSNAFKRWSGMSPDTWRRLH
jgi:AraC-like DNA-binding protein